MSFLDWVKGLGKTESRDLRNMGACVEDSHDDDVDPLNPFPEPVHLPIQDVFDLHTIAPREVHKVIEEYLAEAQHAGFKAVRIIHGKGKGVQRQMVHSILARTPFVDRWSDAPPDAGGMGATIVRFVIENE